MVVIRSEEEFRKYLARGYKPYLMKSQNRWYMRRGQDRPIIARDLEWLARKVAEELKAKQTPPIPAGQIQEMRREGVLVEKIVEKTGLSRSGVYGVFERELGELVRARRPMSEAETPTLENQPSAKLIQEEQAKATEASLFEEALSGLQKYIEDSLKGLYSLEDVERLARKYFSKPENVKDVADLILLFSGLLALPYYKEKDIDPTPISKMIKRIAEERGLWNPQN